MIRICISLFLSGVVLGAGPCLASCGPLLISFVAGTKQSPKEGFFVWLSFSLARLIAYCILALMVGLAAQTIAANFQQRGLSLIYLLGGLFVFLIGILMVSGKWAHNSLCGFLNKNLVDKGIKSSFIFGLIIGLLPCGPLISILAYIGIVSDSWANILLYSLSFSLGTIVSPLLLLTVAAGFIPKIIAKYPNFTRIFTTVCGIIICILGINLIRNFLLIKGL